MNPEKLKKLQAQAAEVRIGGKGEYWQYFRKNYARNSHKFYFVMLFFSQACRDVRRKLFIKAPAPMIRNCSNHWRNSAWTVFQASKRSTCTRTMGESTRARRQISHWDHCCALPSIDLTDNTHLRFSYIHSTVIHFNHPRTQASLSANTFAISGHGDQKTVSFSRISRAHFSPVKGYKLTQKLCTRL